MDLKFVPAVRFSPGTLRRLPVVIIKIYLTIKVTVVNVHHDLRVF